MILLALTEGGFRHKPYFPIFAHIAGSVSGAVLLSHFCHISDEHRGDWFCVTREDLTLLTGLTRSEQERSRKNLVGLGIISEKRVGVPARMHYRLNEFALLTAAEKISKRLLQEHRDD